MQPRWETSESVIGDLRIQLEHDTCYRYDRSVVLSPQRIRLRPAPHNRTELGDYRMQVAPATHRLDWQQDAFGNHIARVLFDGPVTEFAISVALIAVPRPVNPFQFLVDPEAERYPFAYGPLEAEALAPALVTDDAGPRLQALIAECGGARESSVAFLAELTAHLRSVVAYTHREEAGVLDPEETLRKGEGSCRDSAWLLVQLLRHLGLAARFVSGYQVSVPAEGPDIGELHAWAEVYLPGAGWVGLDPSTGLFAGEGYIPLAAATRPELAAPVSGTVSACAMTLDHQIRILRLGSADAASAPPPERAS
jgi:transglutaminase-like putative cysteine protease